ncbi:UPAR/Ly6 domain-containing protein qvr-like [Haliotis cracherodii]|uniref:UPAR/Ly6 domain-containing protein qvr-like n=1 Tax=Haliotis cracherodii TaxID=6455 RepID=UPI001EB04D35
MLTYCLAPLVTIILLSWNVAPSSAQDDYTEPITCYICAGRAINSTCSDPIDVKRKELKKKDCGKGICLKWTFYKENVLYLQRTCSADLNFHLTMIDGVCRTERNGNGYLCMCGKNLCNVAKQSGPNSSAILLLLVCYALISQRQLPWLS